MCKKDMDIILFRSKNCISKNIAPISTNRTPYLTLKKIYMLCWECVKYVICFLYYHYRQVLLQPVNYWTDFNETKTKSCTDNALT